MKTTAGARGLVAWLAVGACAHGGPVPQGAPKASVIDDAKVVGPMDEVAESKRYTGLVTDAALVHNNPVEVITAWLLYGAERAMLWDAQLKKRAGDDFLMESMTRGFLARDWAERRAKGGMPNAELDLMVDVERAGVMNEYVLASFARPGWTVWSEHLAALDVARYRAYADRHLVGHHPVRPVRFYPKDAPGYPAAPGATLPSLVTFAPPQLPCTARHAQFAAALTQWNAEEAQLDGAPLAAVDRTTFLKALDRVRGVAPFAKRGATWVLPAITDLHMMAGFCAVEEGRWADAEKLLVKTVTLDPLAASPRGELALVYARLGRLDDAARAVAEALQLPVSRCEEARLLRRQGYILIDQGKLIEAMYAYGRSLELAPGNSIAEHEMQVVLAELRRRGGADAKTAEAYHPPPRSANVHVTSCPR